MRQSGSNNHRSRRPAASRRNGVALRSGSKLPLRFEIRSDFTPRKLVAGVLAHSGATVTFKNCVFSAHDTPPPTWQQRPQYIVPKDLARSLLYQVIAGDPSYGGKCSLNGLPVTKMPKVDPAVLPNGVPLTQDRIDKIRDWILQGAANN